MADVSVVLLHGGWGGGWEWHAVAELLARRGFDVHRPSFTGLGDRRHLATPDVDLECHVQDVLTLLDVEQLHDVVLVGQSYGGMVVSSVAARCDRVRSLVYLDGFVPDHGDCLLDLIPEPMADHLRELAASGDGWRVPVPFHATEDDPPEVQAYASRANIPTPLGCFIQPATVPVRLDQPATYVRCTRIVGPDLMGESASRARALGWHVVELDATHDAHYFEPEAVAAIVASAST